MARGQGKITDNELHSSLTNELDKIGNTTQLETIDKSNLVSAVNEVKAGFDEHKADYATFKGNTETQLADYNFSVTATDANGKPTQTQYKRADTTLYLQVDATNPDANGNYQTITEQYYDTDGMTLLKTITWTITYNADGLVTGRNLVVS